MRRRVGARREATATAVELDSSKRPLILAIESSCDETAASIIDRQGGLHSDVVASQIDFHSRFGGVVPKCEPQAYRGDLRRVRRMSGNGCASLGALALTSMPGGDVCAGPGGRALWALRSRGAAWAPTNRSSP